MPHIHSSRWLSALGLAFILLLFACKAEPNLVELGCERFVTLVNDVSQGQESALGVVIALEFLAMYNFQEDTETSHPAARLWVAATVLESGGEDFLPLVDARFYSEELRDLCAERNFATPDADPTVIAEFLKRAGEAKQYR